MSKSSTAATAIRRAAARSAGSLCPGRGRGILILPPAGSSRMTRLRISVPLLLLGVLGPRSDAGDLKAGAFAQDVTPTKFPISVNGNMTDVQARGANDPLHARCLVLDDGSTKLAIVVVDSCMVPRELVLDAKAQATKRTGIPADH